MTYQLQTRRKQSAKQMKVKRKKQDNPQYHKVYDLQLVSPTV
jgi:hypothetical protein